MTRWHSLFSVSTDSAALANTLRETVTALGYTLFDPFGLLPGKAYPKAVRLFVAPAVEGWTRIIIGAGDAELARAFSSHVPLVLSLALDGQEAEIGIYAAGNAAGAEALAPYLRPGCALADVERILKTPDLHIVETSQDTGLPLELLPPDVQAMADNVNMKQAQSMFARLTGTALKRAGQGASAADAARSLIAAGNPPDWNSAGGKRLRALVDSLTIPAGWQQPDFTPLRDAYQLHARKRRNPNATLYPGDAEAMASVPDALDYTPVYGGKNT